MVVAADGAARRARKSRRAAEDLSSSGRRANQQRTHTRTAQPALAPPRSPQDEVVAPD
jgi:hypothetical protein